MSAGDPPGIRVTSLFRDLAHAGDMAPGEPDGSCVRGEAGLEALGTRVRFEVATAGGRIVAVRYRAYGCPYTLACCEHLARALEGRPAGAPGVGGPMQWSDRLGIPADRLGRLLVIEDALQAALTQL